MEEMDFSSNDTELELLENIFLEDESAYKVRDDNDDVILGDLAHTSSFSKKTHKEIVSDIMELVTDNHKTFINQRPNFKDFEYFLSVLPYETIGAMREYAINGHYYGNNSLEQMLINEFGVQFQWVEVRKIAEEMKSLGNDVADQVRREMLDATARLVASVTSSFNDNFKVMIKNRKALIVGFNTMIESMKKVEEKYEGQLKNSNDQLITSLQSLVAVKESELNKQIAEQIVIFKNVYMDNIKKFDEGMKKQLLAAGREAHEKFLINEGKKSKIMELVYFCGKTIIAVGTTITFLHLFGYLH